MFCPKCSQPQPSEEMRFCSRCGFSLETVSTLMSHDGVLPQSKIDTNCASIRSRMATESLILTILSWLVAMACTWWFDAHGIYEGIAKLGAVIFFVLGFVGLFRFLYAFLFLKISVASSSEMTLPKEVVRSSLPPKQSIPISDWPREQRTREMVTPASVTENTTRLLDDES